MRLLEELLTTAHNYKMILIFLFVSDLITFCTKDIIDISYSVTNNPSYNSQLTYFIIKIIIQTLATVWLIIVVIHNKILIIMFTTIMYFFSKKSYIVVFLCYILIEVLTSLSYFSVPSRPSEYYNNDIETVINVLMIINIVIKIFISSLLVLFIILLRLIENRRIKENSLLKNNDDMSLGNYNTNTDSTRNSIIQNKYSEEYYDNYDDNNFNLPVKKHLFNKNIENKNASRVFIL